MKNSKILIVFMLAIALIFILAACGNSKLTMENYDKITCATLNETTFQYQGGMTLSEIEDILGKHDSSSSSTVMGNTATAYVWGNEKKNITVSFYENKAILKAQTGL